MIFELDKDELVFPDPALAEANGLLAIGGDLSVERLILAYQMGIFPWFSEGDPVCWYSPHQRCVIYPENIRISKSMHKIFRQKTFKITTDQAFEAVIKQCAAIPRIGQEGTWITAEMQEAYLQLHEMGIAQSIEVWQDSKLVGGLYGIKTGSIFCGESMFSVVSNASKAAIIYLCKDMGFKLIDCQLPTAHLMSLGAEIISRELYLKLIRS